MTSGGHYSRRTNKSIGKGGSELVVERWEMDGKRRLRGNRV